MDHLATKHGVWFHAGILHHAVLGRHARCKVRVRAARGTVHTDRLHQPPATVGYPQGPDGTQIEIQDGTLSTPAGLARMERVEEDESLYVGRPRWAFTRSLNVLCSYQSPEEAFS